MTDCTVTSSSISGIRLMCTRLRQTIVPDARSIDGGAIGGRRRGEHRGHDRASSISSICVGLVLGLVAGEVEEHVVEARALEPEVVDLDAAARETGCRCGSCRRGRRPGR